jgi:hypothetical protein
MPNVSVSEQRTTELLREAFTPEEMRALIEALRGAAWITGDHRPHESARLKLDRAMAWAYVREASNGTVR